MDAGEIARVVQSELSVSDKIRALAAGGCARADIARALGKRYQHVRNVLEADRANAAGARGAGQGVAETSPPHAGPPRARDVEDRGGGAFRLTLREDGSVMIPSAVRAAFNLKPGQPLMARLEGDEFKLINTATALRRIDERMAPYRGKGGESWVDSFIVDRRAEAAREDADD